MARAYGQKVSYRTGVTVVAVIHVNVPIKWTDEFGNKSLKLDRIYCLPIRK